MFGDSHIILPPGSTVSPKDMGAEPSKPKLPPEPGQDHTPKPPISDDEILNK